MKNFLIIAFFIAVQSLSVVEAQNYNTAEIVTVEGKKYILHKVDQGETIFSICKKFKVEQKDLVVANPQLIFGLKQGDILNVPYVLNPEKENQQPEVKQEKVDFIYHVVKKSETVYSIAREYNVDINSIYHFNPEAEGEVLENEIIRIPKNYVQSEVDGLIREDNDFYYHKVQPKENVYSLARRYNVSVGAIFDANPAIEENFEVGSILRIPKNQQGQAGEQLAVKTGEFFLHRVEMGDTFYSYKRRFGVSKEQLIELNPELNDGLLAGLTIKIPAVKIEKVEVIPVNTDDFISHNVTKGETLYSISRQYNVKVLDIKELNPELKVRGLIAGETIYLPKVPEFAVGEVVSEPDIKEVPEVVFEVQEEEEPVCRKEYSLLDDDTFRISMFLPLFFDKNDTFNLVRRSDEEIAFLESKKRTNRKILKTFFRIETDSQRMVSDTILVDSLKVKEVRSLYPPSKPFVDFYEGFLLALDSMQQVGIKVRLNLYDSEFSEQVVDSILMNNDFINTDLIIGPVPVNLQKVVSDFSYKNQIPMVSPLSSNDELLSKNPFYFQVNPTKDYIVRKTSDFIGDEFYDKNFIIMTLGNADELKENNLVNLVRDKFFSSGVYNNLNEIRFTEVDFTRGGNLGYWQVKKILKPNMENVIFIPATENTNEREAMLSRAINSLHVLAEEFDITLVGMSDYPRFASISTEYFHQLKLSYLTPYRIDYSRIAVNNFIKKYRKSFSSEPEEYSYSFRGYDIGLYFIGAYQQFGKNFTECIGGYRNDGLLQSNFNFQKVDARSGFMNHTLYIMKYTSDFDINVISKVTEGRVILK